MSQPGIPATKVGVRVPVSVLLNAHEHRTLGELVGECDVPAVDMAIGMIQKGVTGPLVETQTEGSSTQIVVEDYEN